jgi:hypothetical protein
VSKLLDWSRLPSLLAGVKDFEEVAHTEVEIILRTDGRVKFAVHLAESDMWRTETFRSIREALDWLEVA